MTNHHHFRIPHEGLFVIGVILTVFLLSVLCLAGFLNPREVLDCSLFRCCWKRRTEGDHYTYNGEEPHTYPTITEFIFEANNSETAGFVDSMEQGDHHHHHQQQQQQQQEVTMNHIFPDLLAQEEGGETSINQPLLQS
jgi:hypothetical protein